MQTEKAEVAIVGGGPAGLMAAEISAGAGFAVTIYERMPSLARKFLLAGRGGLNITHSEPLDAFGGRFGEAGPRVADWLEAFSPQAMREWSEGLGEPTFVGSSGRVFPKSFKASPLLRAWLRRLAAQGVQVKFGHRFTGWDQAGHLCFSTSKGEVCVEPSTTVLAMGGASWPKLGSDGAWTAALSARKIALSPLRASNCGFEVAWSDIFKARFAGAPLKNVALDFAGTHIRGEAMVTRTGIEGGAIYALSNSLRDAIEAEGKAVLNFDLAPDVSETALAERLKRQPKGQTMTSFIRKAAGLPPVSIALLREAAGVALPNDAAALAALIKHVPIELVGIAPIARAISTAGGVKLDEVDENLMLKSMPGVFVAGEMLDWEAPTGGYLLQAVMASGRVAGAGAARWLASRPSQPLLLANSTV